MAAFQTGIDGNVRILAISGRLDLHSGRDLKDTMQSLIDSDDRCDLLVDLENLDYMASTGFRELFLAGRQVIPPGRPAGRLLAPRRGQARL